jgi:hypothetical protein
MLRLQHLLAGFELLESQQYDFVLTFFSLVSSSLVDHVHP